MQEAPTYTGNDADDDDNAPLNNGANIPANLPNIKSWTKVCYTCFITQRINKTIHSNPNFDWKNFRSIYIKNTVHNSYTVKKGLEKNV